MLKFNWLDKFMSYLRLKQIKPYIGEGGIICDLGCGDGNVLKSVSLKIKNGIGLDRDIMNSRKDNLCFIQADVIQPLPLENNKFDVVLLLAVLEHLTSHGVLFEEIWRILRPGGKLILTTPSPHSRFLLEFLAFKLKIISKEGVLDHKHYYSKQELKDLLLKFGFKIIKIKSFEFGMNFLAVAQKMA
jgi:2-polyprenyl-3-methyl-5-hydroxy-6-metoxy-1,4-benzoquinol methylase